MWSRRHCCAFVLDSEYGSVRRCMQAVRVCIVCVQYIPCLVVVEGIKKRLKSLPTIISGPVTWPAPWAAFYVHL